MKTTIVRNTYNLKSVETYEGETIETKVVISNILSIFAEIFDESLESEALYG